MKCRAGVLQGGNCDNYTYSKGKASNACVNNQVRLFNVNESESLGPYMARYLGAKWYRGENYYLQIDSHSEFVKNWDTKLIGMLQNAPAKKPVLSTYPSEWQIIRLDASGPSSSIPKEPSYAPFVAAER
eukprot:gene39451-53336_t